MTVILGLLDEKMTYYNQNFKKIYKKLSGELVSMWIYPVNSLNIAIFNLVNRWQNT